MFRVEIKLFKRHKKKKDEKHKVYKINYLKQSCLILFTFGICLFNNF